MSRETKYDCDVLVVGAGLVGCWLALVLTRSHPELKVRVVERSTVGSGASCASAGFDAVESEDPYQRALAIRSRELYREISGDIPAARVVKVPTYWVINSSDAATFPSRFRLEDETRDGPVERAKGELLDFIVDDAARVFFENESGYASPPEICRDIMEYLAAFRQVRLEEHTKFTAYVHEGEGCRSNLSDGRTIRSRLVLMATGAFPLKRVTMPLLRNTVRRRKVGSIIIDTAPKEGSAAVVYGDLGCFFLPQTEARRWLFSFTVGTWGERWRHNPKLTTAEWALGMSILSGLRPDLARLPAAAQVAYDLYPERNEPLALQLTPNSWFVGGFAGAGYRLAPAFIEQLLTEGTLAMELRR